MVKVKSILKSLLLSIVLVSSCLSSSFLSAEPAKFEMSSESNMIHEGTPFWVALELSLEDGWHAYWKNPGDAGMAPHVTWTLPDGFKVISMQWPTPSLFSSTIGDTQTEAYGFADQAVLLAEILPPAEIQESKELLEIKADLKWVICNDETCLPGSEDQTIKLSVTKDKPVVNPEKIAYFKMARGKMPRHTEAVTSRSSHSIQEFVVDLKQKVANLSEKTFFFSDEGKSHVAVSAHPDNASYAVFTLASEEPSPKGVLVSDGIGYDIDLTHENTLVAVNEASVESQGQVSLTADHDWAKEDGIDSFWIALVFAFAGGMLLNLMPCVLPVISLKVLSFINLAGKNRFETFKHGLMFSLGVLISFWALAATLLILQAWGHSVGWGFQLQEPIFVAGLAVLVVMFALSLFGVFEFGALFASWAGDKQSENREGPWSSFFSGILATAIATPCTGPFLGSAVGYAFTIPPLACLVVFTFLGLGMAFPYLILTAFPSMLRFVPKPGQWMETFKQSMGFMMLFAALWLTWVFAGETEDPAVVILLASYLAIGLACWILGKWAVPYKSRLSKIIGWSFALVLMTVSVQAIVTASNLTSSGSASSKEIADLGSPSSNNQGGWENFSAKRVEELRAQGVPVFIDFTAKWCLVCQTNHIVLTGSDVESKMAEKGVVKMKADWTKNDPEITKELQKWGRRSVPLYLLYTNETPKILPQILTGSGIIAELNEIK